MANIVLATFIINKIYEIRYCTFKFTTRIALFQFYEHESLQVSPVNHLLIYLNHLILNRAQSSRSTTFVSIRLLFFVVTTIAYCSNTLSTEKYTYECCHNDSSGGAIFSSNSFKKKKKICNFWCKVNRESGQQYLFCTQLYFRAFPNSYRQRKFCCFFLSLKVRSPDPWHSEHGINVSSTNDKFTFWTTRFGCNGYDGTTTNVR